MFTPDGVTRFFPLLLNAFSRCWRFCQRYRKANWLSRKSWVALHLYIALGLGLPFAVLGLTGSLLVYQEALDELLNPALVIDEPQSNYQSLDKIIAAVRAEHPKRFGEWTLELPRGPHSMMTVWFEKPRETYFERYAPLMVSVNPYTAEVVTSRFWGQTVMTWIADLHTTLLLEDAGWNTVGACGIFLLCSVISGLYLWWPGIGHIRSVLAIRLHGGWIRLLYDLHRWAGVLSAVILVILAFTGFNLSFPQVLEKMAGSSGMAHGETGQAVISTAQPNNHPTLLEAAEFIARSPFPTAQLRRVTTPDGNSGVYRVNLRQKSEINQRHPYTTVWIDRWSGQIRAVRDPKAFNAGEQLITWIWPMHTGEALGDFGRFCWFLTGQGVFFLYVSGIVRWLHKKGLVKDRPVNLSGLRRWRKISRDVFSRLLVALFQWLRGLIRQIKPLLQKRISQFVAYCKLSTEDKPKDWF